MHQENETLPKVLEKVSNQLVNAADGLNRLNRLQHLLIRALDIIQTDTDQAEFMLELYEDHACEYLEELTNQVQTARKLLGHPVSESELVVLGSERSPSHCNGSTGSSEGS